MNIFNDKIKKAFTLMEIGMGLLVLSILVIVCIPIITNQVKKTDEYSYYLAFKTVEKMGSQIVAFGDPEGVATNNENTGAYYNSPKKQSKFANLTDKVFKFFNPKAYAVSDTSKLLSFPSYEYDYVRVCLGNSHVMKESDEHATNYWTENEITSVQNEEYCRNLKFNSNDKIKKRFMCPNGLTKISSAQLLEKLMNSIDTNNKMEDLQNFCKYISDNCENSTYNVVKLAADNEKITYECYVNVADPDAEYTHPNLGQNSDVAPSSPLICDSQFGTKGMTNNASGGSLLCSCDAAHPVKAINNKNICCATPTTGKYAYYSHKSASCVNCALGAFNEKTEVCCPDNASYNSSLGKCVCKEGYTPDSDSNLTVCNMSGSTCPAGSHLENSNCTDNCKCISNAPIIKAQRFCELVSYYWNTSSHKCNTFFEDDGVGYYSSLFSAITANNTPYLSASAVEGAFRNIEPNITFANGLMMWILSDKSASIPGLSYNPEGFTPKINTCKILSDTQEASCTEPSYYCKNEEKCLTITRGEGENILKDARNCCSTSNLSDLVFLYEGKDYLRDLRTYAINGFTVFVDINGKKDNDELGGGGTLWKDVFPFYVSSNGNVYPGYPLNAAKAAKPEEGTEGSEGNYNTTKDSSALYQGGNSSYLSTDVFYYDIVDGRRTKINVYPSVPYARALCLAGEISAYTPYCQNLGSKFRIVGDKSYSRIDQFVYSDDNPCYKHSCFVKLKNKIKFL